MNKLAIVGAEPRTRGNAPFDNEDYDIWAIANWANADWMKRCDAVIEVHIPRMYQSHPKDPGYWNWLQNNEHAEVYMQRPDGGVPMAVEMPLDDLLALTSNIKVMGKDARVINSSVAFALSLAIHLGYAEIDIYGAEMVHSSEYRSQQPIFAFWIGYAAGKGVKLNINCSEGLFIQPIYGYENLFNNNEKIFEYRDGLKGQKSELTKQLHMIEGAEMLLAQIMEED